MKKDEDSATNRKQKRAGFLGGLAFAAKKGSGNFMPDTPNARRGLSLLGRSDTPFPESPSRETLETFVNRYPQRAYVVTFESADFTSLCPITGQPDFAELTIEYIPAERCIETKSLKFYLAAYRNARAFNEEVANRILDDLVAVCAPRRMRVFGRFAPRGGIALSVEATHDGPAPKRKKGRK
jgi:7-cyano-7-deazaguanine reductase